MSANPALSLGVRCMSYATRAFIVVLTLFCLAGCKTSSTSEQSLKSLWQRWQPIQPPEKLADHDWLLGAWHCKQREFLTNSLIGAPNGYVYMVTTKDAFFEHHNKESHLRLIASFLMPDRHGRFGKAGTVKHLGYYDGVYGIGSPFAYHAFYMRRNPRNLTNEFILKYETREEYFRFERIAPEHWEELWDLWEAQQLAAELAAWAYLGIPADEEYPNSRFELDKEVPQNKYWRISKIRRVSLDEYESDVASGRAIFRILDSDRHYYATEQRGDFFQNGETRFWVTILERKVYP